MTRTGKKGFTIIELVVVIAVIAILSAVLIPTFSGVIKKAKEAAFSADLKAAYTQYASEKAQAEEDVQSVIYVKFAGESADTYYKITNGNTADIKSTDGIMGTCAATVAGDPGFADGRVFEALTVTHEENTPANGKCAICGTDYVPTP